MLNDGYFHAVSGFTNNSKQSTQNPCPSRSYRLMIGYMFSTINVMKTLQATLRAASSVRLFQIKPVYASLTGCFVSLPSPFPHIPVLTSSPRISEGDYIWRQVTKVE